MSSIWFNGEIKKNYEVNIDLSTHALHYATSVYEGIRSYNGKILKLNEHIDRLLKSAISIGLSIDFSKEEIIQATYQILKENRLLDAYIRPVIFRGSGNLRVGSNNPVNIAIIANEITHDCSKKLSLTVSEWQKFSNKSFPKNCKGAATYAVASFIKINAANHGFDDAIMLDCNNNVAEATTSNIFMVKDNKVITPLTDFILNGITRQMVIEILKDLEIPIYEEFFTLDKLLEADEIFLTGTSIEIMNVCKVQNKNFPDNHITKNIQEKYFEIIRKLP